MGARWSDGPGDFVAHPFRRAGRILRTAETELAELFLGHCALVWGAWLLNPRANTFAAGGPGWRAMSDLAREEIWGLCILILGLWQILALHYDRRSSRIHAALASTAFWAFVAVMLYFSNPQGLGFLVYGMIALLSAFCYLRLPRQRPFR